MEGLLANLVSGLGDGPADDALAEAQEIMYDAWDTADRRKRISLARKALKVSPLCADAFVLLARESAKTPEEAIDLYRQGLVAGERALGPAAFEEDVGHFWGLLETRPYMRARAGLAQALWAMGHHDEAIGHYRDLLRLNPNDNQGIRYLLAACLLDLDRDEDLLALLASYGPECTADWAYTTALAEFRRDGDTPSARKRLKEAAKTNPYVADYLLGKKKPPAALPDYISMGGEDEAQEYARRNANAWMRTDGALAWLATQIPAKRTGRDVHKGARYRGFDCGCHRPSKTFSNRSLTARSATR